MEEPFHPGTCEATARGKRYGTNQTPQRFDEPRHVWHRAKTLNWGPWSCCGGAANVQGCQMRVPRAMPTRGVRAMPTSTASRGVGAYVQFLINERARVRVAGEAVNCWILSSGRIAKKATHGTSWVWAQESESDVDNLNDPFSRFMVQERSVARFRVVDPQHPFYSFGNWGYHTNAHDSQIMPGFSLKPPGAEICGTYNVVYVAALCYDTNRQRANILLRRQPRGGRLIIKEATQSVTIGVDGRLGTSRASGSVTSPAIFDGEVTLPSYHNGVGIDRYFGPGYKFFGFGPDSDEATSSDPSMAANASLIVTKQNDNKGRIYRVESPKAFKLASTETGVLADESASFDSQEQETKDARRI